MSESADLRFMRLALEQAESAITSDEVPVGAVLVQGEAVIALSGNQVHTATDPTAHAEIEVIRAASERLGNHRLVGTTLYVTLEPCLMCVGAMVHARIERLVYGAREPRTGAVVSAFDLLMSDRHNHRVAITEGVLASESSELLRQFFEARR